MRRNQSELVCRPVRWAHWPRHPDNRLGQENGAATLPLPARRNRFPTVWHRPLALASSIYVAELEDPAPSPDGVGVDAGDRGNLLVGTRHGARLFELRQVDLCLRPLVCSLE